MTCGKGNEQKRTRTCDGCQGDAEQKRTHECESQPACESKSTTTLNWKRNLVTENFDATQILIRTW